jgi:hypothetical protein
MDIESVINSLQKIKDSVDAASAEDLQKYRKVLSDIRYWDAGIMKGLCRVGNMIHDIEESIAMKESLIKTSGKN